MIGYINLMYPLTLVSMLIRTSSKVTWYINIYNWYIDIYMKIYQCHTKKGSHSYKLFNNQDNISYYVIRKRLEQQTLSDYSIIWHSWLSNGAPWLTYSNI